MDRKGGFPTTLKDSIAKQNNQRIKLEKEVFLDLPQNPPKQDQSKDPSESYYEDQDLEEYDEEEEEENSDYNSQDHESQSETN